MSALEGRKHDDGKAAFDLVPIYPLECLAKVLTMGAGKYGIRNWEQGIRWGRCYAALMRHMVAFWNGEDLDPESGMPHLAHAMANVVFLLEYTQTHSELDDRPRKPKVLKMTREQFLKYVEREFKKGKHESK